MGAFSGAGTHLPKPKSRARQKVGGPASDSANTRDITIGKEVLTLTIVRQFDGTEDFFAFPSETSPFLERLHRDGRLRVLATRETEFVVLPPERNTPISISRLKTLCGSPEYSACLCLATIVGHYESFFSTALLALKGDFKADELGMIKALLPMA
jgi:hypothetical protein